MEYELNKETKYSGNEIARGINIEAATISALVTQMHTQGDSIAAYNAVIESVHRLIEIADCITEE